MTLYTKRQRIKAAAPANVHLPNTNEAKMLRKIRAETGLSEIEVRNIKKYRKMLSEAQDVGERELTVDEMREKYSASIYKTITKRLKLAKEHPLVVAEYKEYLKTHRGYLPFYLFYP